LNKAIFIDRDGVINRSILIDGKPHAPLLFNDFFIFNNVFESLEKIKKKGFKTVIITNQPNLSPKRATLSITELNKMHNFLKSKSCIDAIYVCPHIDSDMCNCRKPEIGNILKAKKEFNLDLSLCYFIGDRYQDIKCANNANLKGCFFIDYKYNETTEHIDKKLFASCNIVQSLSDICKFI
tara:strand:+ start:442 stop:984 length:543 start_codon:yes stop_codon:yes gene_type:complete